MFIASGLVEDRKKIQYFFHHFQQIHKGCFCEPFVFIGPLLNKRMSSYLGGFFFFEITLFSPAWCKIITRLLKFDNSQYPYQANHFLISLIFRL